MERITIEQSNLVQIQCGKQNSDPDINALEKPVTELHSFFGADINEITHYLSSLIAPHQAIVPEPYSFRGKIKGVRLKYINFINLKYNQDTIFNAKNFISDYLVIIPLSGQCIISNEKTQQIISSESIGILGNGSDFKISWKANTRLSIIKFDRLLIENCRNESHFDCLLMKSKPISMRLSMNNLQVDSFTRFADFFRREVENQSGLEYSSSIASELQNTLLTMLVYILNSDGDSNTKRLAECARPPYIKRVEKYIEQHLHDSLSISDIVEATNVNARTLFHAFKRYHGITPMAYMKMKRLNNAHKILLAAEPDSTTVTEVATDWGFYHLGRFSADYKSVFKELPSETLRR